MTTWGFPLLLNKSSVGPLMGVIHNKRTYVLHLVISCIFVEFLIVKRKKMLKDMKNRCNYSDVREDLVSLLNWAFHARQKNSICDFAAIKKTSVGKKNFFFNYKMFLRNCSLFLVPSKMLIQTSVEKQKFQQSFVSLRMTQFHQKCVLVFINFIMKMGIYRKVPELGTVGSLRMYLILCNSPFHFEKTIGHLS